MKKRWCDLRPGDMCTFTARNENGISNVSFLVVGFQPSLYEGLSLMYIVPSVRYVNVSLCHDLDETCYDVWCHT